jgi:integrase
VRFEACTATRIGEVSGVQVRDINRDTWTWDVCRQTAPGPGGLIDKGTKGKRRRTVPITEEIRPMVARRLDSLRHNPTARLFTGPRGGRIATAVLRHATHWATTSPASATSTCAGTVYTHVQLRLQPDAIDTLSTALGGRKTTKTLGSDGDELLPHAARVHRRCRQLSAVTYREAPPGTAWRGFKITFSHSRQTEVSKWRYLP